MQHDLHIRVPAPPTLVKAKEPLHVRQLAPTLNTDGRTVVTSVTPLKDSVNDIAFLLENVFVEVDAAAAGLDGEEKTLHTRPPKVLVLRPVSSTPAGTLRAMDDQEVSALLESIQSYMSPRGEQLLSMQVLQGPPDNVAGHREAPWFITPEQTSSNMFHCHNENLLPLYTGMIHTGFARKLEMAAFSGLSSSPSAVPEARVTPSGRMRVVHDIACPGKEGCSQTADVPTILQRISQTTAHEFSEQSFCQQVIRSIFPASGFIKDSHAAPGNTRRILKLDKLWIGRTPRAFRGMQPALLSYAGMQVAPRLRALMWHAAGVPLGLRMPVAQFQHDSFSRESVWLTVPQWCRWRDERRLTPCSKLQHSSVVQLLATRLAPERTGPSASLPAFPGLSFDGIDKNTVVASMQQQCNSKSKAGFDRYKVWPPTVGILDRENSRRLKDGGEEFLAFVRSGGAPAARFVMQHSLTPWQQVRRMAALDVLVTPHGAGNTLCLYLSQHAACVQVLPRDADFARMTLFQMISALAGVQYREWQSREKGNWLSAPVSVPARSKAEIYRVTKWWDALLVEYGQRNGILDIGSTVPPVT